MTAPTREFALNPTANWGPAGPKYIITVAPIELFRRFGYPILNDGDSESLGTYVFESADGKVVNVYFRAYDVWSLFLRFIKRSFWRRTKPTELTVGAEHREAAEEFCGWLATKLPIQARRWP